MLFDSHTHVNFQPFFKTYKEVIGRAQAANIMINNVGTQWESSQRSVAIAEEYKSGVVATVGLHPLHLFHDVTEEQALGEQVQKIRARAERFDYEQYKQLALSSKKVVAIGECGLDYYHFQRAQVQEFREELTALQKSTLRQHCDLALELDKAVVIHCRDAVTHTSRTIQAFLDVLEIVRSYNGKLRGVIHCYTGLPEYVSQFLELGFYIGYTGIATFPDATEVQASVRATPLNRLLLETDAPYLTPMPYRGKPNEPAYVQYVANAIAALQDVSVEQVAKQTTANAFELFRLS
ncbi:MAG: Hydrolase, TatD family [uncultured bacterium]|nr:MAG: Hydrolase, TatD family [uncultured bacterium]